MAGLWAYNRSDLVCVHSRNMKFETNLWDQQDIQTLTTQPQRIGCILKQTEHCLSAHDQMQVDWSDARSHKVKIGQKRSIMPWPDWSNLHYIWQLYLTPFQTWEPLSMNISTQIGSEPPWEWFISHSLRNHGHCYYCNLEMVFNLTNSISITCIVK